MQFPFSKAENGSLSAYNQLKGFWQKHAAYSFDKLLRAPFDFRRIARGTSKEDWNACLEFVLEGSPSLLDRISIIKQLFLISSRVWNYHTQEEMLQVINAILKLPPGEEGVVVEAGCFKGASTAKFSLAAALAGKELVVFDSFEGLPSNTEKHEKTIFGEHIWFHEGRYSGGLEEVRQNVTTYGNVKCCRFVQGWFNETLPNFGESVSTAFLDVDLVSSTRTCVKYLYPLLKPGGTLFSQDGHLPLVIELLE